MLKDTFCSSPWFHLQLNHDGRFKKCRFGKWGPGTLSELNISQTSLLTFYNSDEMKKFRLDMLNGEKLNFCDSCYYEDSFNKLSGRVKQLYKSSIDLNNFELTARSSPHYDKFLYSQNNLGESNHKPVDLQIMLSNTCNSACIMCEPESSSRLNLDYKKLHKINSKIFKSPANNYSWTHDSVVLEKFIEELTSIRNLRYLHFLGGETFYDDAFYQISDALLEQGIDDVIIGTTTNGTIINDKIRTYISKFKNVHLGISIESVTALNDYIRWPSKIESVLVVLDQYLKLRDQNSNLHLTLRITPNILSMYEIDKLFVYMLENNISAESCNILYNPPQLKIELLPQDIRLEIIEKIKNVIEYYELKDTNVVNIRRSDLVRESTSKVILDYYNFMCNYTVPSDADDLRFKLVEFLKGFEHLRKNSIIDYLPRYENFLRSYGY